MKASEIKELAELQDKCGYHDANKARFKTLAMKLLRATAKAAGLAPATYDIRFNAGGIAVSGEATLHAENVYVQVSADVGFGGGMCVLVRTCKGRKDYAGGANQWYPLARLADKGAEGLGEFVARVAAQSVAV